MSTPYERQFIKDHPEHELTGDALNNLGETYYASKDFERAAFTFADSYQRFPKSRVAPDNLMKLGMALGQLGQAKEACTAFTRLLANFPVANFPDFWIRTVRNRVRSQRQLYQCR